MPSHAKRCRYCRVPCDKPTWDHGVPKWVLRLFPQVQRTRKFILINRVTACARCNQRKGSMPVAIFVGLLAQPPKIIKGERTRWDQIAAKFAKLHYEEANAHPLAEMIVTEFRRPIPPRFATGDRRIEIRAGAAASHPGIFLE